MRRQIIEFTDGPYRLADRKLIGSPICYRRFCKRFKKLPWWCSDPCFQPWCDCRADHVGAKTGIGQSSDEGELFNLVLTRVDAGHAAGANCGAVNDCRERATLNLQGRQHGLQMIVAVKVAARE